MSKQKKKPIKSFKLEIEFSLIPLKIHFEIKFGK